MSETHPSEDGYRYHRLLEMCHGLEPVRTAVVQPTDEASLEGALQAARLGLIQPILIGNEDQIRSVAQEQGLSLDGLTILSARDDQDAACQAVALVRYGNAEAIMKGNLHTDTLMSAVVDPGKGLRTERRISHVFAIDAPRYPKSIFVTDAAVNVYPTLTDKRDIVQNAIDLARTLGVVQPKVAILSAVELVTEKIRSTIDAAALCKMADRKQITGGILDGPLAFDNAVSFEAALSKGIVSPVAGHADILVVPDLEAGNMLAKQLEYLADAQMAGIVLGARAPIMLTSRADKVPARLGSCAIALLLARQSLAPRSDVSS